MAERNEENDERAQVFEEFKKKIVEAKFCGTMGKHRMEFAYDSPFHLEH